MLQLLCTTTSVTTAEWYGWRWTSSNWNFDLTDLVEAVACNCVDLDYIAEHLTEVCLNRISKGENKLFFTQFVHEESHNTGPNSLNERVCTFKDVLQEEGTVLLLVAYCLSLVC